MRLRCRPRPTLAAGFAVRAWGPYAKRGRAVRACGLLLAGYAVSACGPGLANGRLYAAPPQANASDTLAELSRVRSLPLDAPVDLQNVDDAAFLDAFHAMNRATSSKRPRGGAFWSAFTMAGASTDVNAMADAMMDDNLDGFYDPHVKRLYVRQRAKPSAAGGERLTLAHEEEHALQDRFFGIPDIAMVADADQALAIRALFEGDATLSSVVLDATRHGYASAEAVAHVARFTNDDLLLRAGGVRAPNGAPPLLRAELAWPYVRGTLFVGQLAASGGWALVNAAMRNPPRTTEQVLHIEKYIEGEGPIDVRVPGPPAGYTPVEIGRMGELRTRFLLAECMVDAGASDAARGWGGDAYVIAARGSERTLLWATAWDDEAAAARFATALEARRVCDRTGVKPPFTVVRSGTRVAFVQGLTDDAARTKEATKLLSLVGKTPPSLPPLGQVELLGHPPISTDFAHGGVIEGGKFTDPPLGVASDLPGLTPAKNDALELYAMGEGVNVGVGFVWSPPSRTISDVFTASFVDGVRSKSPGEKIFDEGTSPVPLWSTTAEARTLRIGDHRKARVILVPSCQGKMTLILVTVFQPDSFGQLTAEAWLRSVRVSESSPACEALKTLRDPSEARR